MTIRYRASAGVVRRARGRAYARWRCGHVRGYESPRHPRANVRDAGRHANARAYVSLRRVYVRVDRRSFLCSLSDLR